MSQLAQSNRGEELPPANPFQPPPFGQEDEVDLGAFLAHLLDSWKLIAVVTAVALAAAVVYALAARPVYSADALIQVEDKGAATGLNDLSKMFSGTTPADTEIEIIRSRSVLGQVIDALQLDLVVKPSRMPLIGGAIARRHEATNEALSPAWLGLSHWGWGGEKLEIERLELPDELVNRELILVAGRDGAFSLLRNDGSLLLAGKVGTLAEATVSGSEKLLRLFVARLISRPGERFSVTKRGRPAVLNGLRGRLTVAEKGKNTGIIALALKGSDPAKLVTTLDTLENVYLRQNVEQKSAQADKTLQFLDGQIPQVRAQLEHAESALNAYQSQTGTVDLKLETKALLDQSVDVAKRLSELKLQRSELQGRFTASHPSLIAVDRQISQLEQKTNQLEGQVKALPEAELKQVQLMRDVQVSTEIYLLLLNKSQELKIVKSGTIGNVRVLDRAQVDRSDPVWPKKKMVLLGGLLLGFAVGLGLASVKRALNRGLSDPEAVEAALAVPVYATVPHSEALAKRMRVLARRGDRSMPLLTAVDPRDMALESLRSLRTSLQFAFTGPRPNVLLIAGLRAGVGKSFISANLAEVVGTTGKRVLLIDGDLRRGVLHGYFGLERGPGVSEVATSALEPNAAIRETGANNVWVVTTGQLPPNPSELLLGPGFASLVAWASLNYELVIIDAPPILAVTDAAIIGRMAGVSMLVLKAGLHPVREVALGLSRFEQNGVKIHGAVLNDMPRLSSAAQYGKYGYQYQYEYR